MLHGRYGLALTLIAPVLVNILALHLFLAPGGLPIPLVLLATELFLAYRYRDAFAPMLHQLPEEQSPSFAQPTLVSILLPTSVLSWFELMS